jgi:hypothetical protein
MAVDLRMSVFWEDKLKHYTNLFVYFMV